MYYKLRCNLTQFVIYYKLRNYYKLQRNTALTIFENRAKDIHQLVYKINQRVHYMNT